MPSPIPSPSPAIFPPKPPIDLLVWDAPNIDMTLAGILGARPTPATRPRYDQLALWFLAGSEDREVQAAVFTNYAEGTAGSIRPWLEAIRSFGFDVFIKPKFAAEDDIDDAMVAHINATATTHRLVRLVVVSGDGRNFQGPLEDLAKQGVDVTVVAFDDVASWARQMPDVSFVDLEDIPGAFKEPLDRIRLGALPLGGAWLRATKSLRELAPASSTSMAN